MLYDVIVFRHDDEGTYTDTVTGSRRWALERRDEIDRSNRQPKAVAAVLDVDGRHVDRIGTGARR